MSRLVVDTDVAMQARDGVRLVADVYRVDDAEPRPVLLLRTPYDKSNPLFISGIVVDPMWLARNGYVVVVQDVRGRFASGGDYDFFVQELDDGYDAVEWAAAQPWSDGRVGVYGSSYHAMSTLAAVAARPPHLRAAMALVGTPAVGPTNRPGGLFELGFLAMYCLTQSPDTIARSTATAEEKAELIGRLQAAVADPLAYVSGLPVADLPVLSDPRAVPWWTTWLHAEPDDPHWCSDDVLLAEPERVTVPLLQVAGFADFLSPPMIGLHEQIQADRRHALVIGPWTHYGTYTGSVGGLDVRATAGGGPGTLGPMVLGWFDRWLRDREAAVPHGVRYFSTGDMQWHANDSWPPPSDPLELCLAGDGTEDGALAAEPGAGPDRYRYDPLEPVPTCGGMLASPLLGADGVQDQSSVTARPDVLVYTSDVLIEPLRVVGTTRLVLHLETTVEDTDVVVTLVDVGTDGIGHNVAEGALRARYRHGGHDDWLVPGEVTELTVALHPTAHTFATGHRVRLLVTSSSFPRLSRNLNSRVVPELGTTTDVVIAEQAVHHDVAHPSRLVLPRAAATSPSS